MKYCACLLIVLLFASCAGNVSITGWKVEKRRYTPGWHMQVATGKATHTAISIPKKEESSANTSEAATVENDTTAHPETQRHVQTTPFARGLEALPGEMADIPVIGHMAPLVAQGLQNNRALASQVGKVLEMGRALAPEYEKNDFFYDDYYSDFCLGLALMALLTTFVIMKAETYNEKLYSWALFVFLFFSSFIFGLLAITVLVDDWYWWNFIYILLGFAILGLSFYLSLKDYLFV